MPCPGAGEAERPGLQLAAAQFLDCHDCNTRRSSAGCLVKLLVTQSTTQSHVNVAQRRWRLDGVQGRPGRSQPCERWLCSV